MYNNLLINQSIYFFNQIFGQCWSNGHFILWCKETKISCSFSADELNEVPAFITEINNRGQTIFFGVGLQKERIKFNSSGMEETVSAIPALCIDIDIATPERKEKELPQTIDEALQLLHRINLTPSITVWTGAGFQAYWILNSPFIIKNNMDMQEAKMVSDTFTKKIQTIASEIHLRIDNVAALNHPMRIPGLPNYKYPNSIATIYDNTNLRYDMNKLYEWAKDTRRLPNKNILIQNKFDLNSPGALNRAVSEYPSNTNEYISAINTYIWNNILNISPPIANIGSYAPLQSTTEPTPDEINDLLVLPFETAPDPVVAQIYAPPVATVPEVQAISDKLQLLYQLIERCAFLKHCRDDSKALPEPLWFLMIRILAHEPNGDILIHELSKDYPKYTKAETDKYIQNAIKSSSGPIRCDTIKSHWDCKTNCNVTCPVHLKTLILQEMAAENDETDSSDAVNSQVLKERIKDTLFPKDIYPNILLNSLTNLSKVISVEEDFVFCAALVVIGTAIGAKFKVAAKRDYSSNMSLWMAIIADTGKKKTPVLNALTKVLYEIQRQLTAKYELELRIYKQKLAKKNNPKNQTNSSATTKSPATNLPATGQSNDDDPILPPANMAVITTDPTVEALIERLKDSPNGILRFNDEIKVLIDGFDKYKGKQSGELEIYLSLYNGTPIKVDRMDKTTFVPYPYLCILGGIQPQKLKISFSSGSFDDGFCARFLFYNKDDISRELNRSEWTDQDKQVWENLIKVLYNYEEPQQYSLGDEAWEVFKNYSISLTIQSIYFPNMFKGFPEKMETYSLRFSGIIHVLKIFYEIEENSNTISKSTMDKAVELSNYFLYQARKMFEAYSPQSSVLDKDSQSVLESIIKINQDTNSKSIPVAAILIQFNLIVDSSAVINSEKVFGKLIYKIMKDLNIQYESKKVYVEDHKQRKCLILTEKSLSKIYNILSDKYL